VRQAWPIIEPLTPFVEGWHIDALIDHLEVTRGHNPATADQRPSPTHKEHAGFSVVAGLGMDPPP
jgi:hypothetical protein